MSNDTNTQVTNYDDLITRFNTLIDIAKGQLQDDTQKKKDSDSQNALFEAHVSEFYGNLRAGLKTDNSLEFSYLKGNVSAMNTTLVSTQSQVTEHQKRIVSAERLLDTHGKNLFDNNKRIKSAEKDIVTEKALSETSHTIFQTILSDNKVNAERIDGVEKKLDRLLETQNKNDIPPAASLKLCTSFTREQKQGFAQRVTDKSKYSSLECEDKGVHAGLFKVSYEDENETEVALIISNINICESELAGVENFCSDITDYTAA